MRVGALVVLACGGCNAILGIGDIHATGASDAAADSRPDAPACPAMTVCGTAAITWQTASGDVTSAKDLTGYSIAAYVPDGSATGFSIEPATITEPGMFTIANVPDGPAYYLKGVGPGGIVTLVETSLHTVDLDVSEPGRADIVHLTNDVTVHFAVDGMTAWADGDTLAMDAYNVGTEYYGVEGVVATPPTAGSTSVGTDFMWSNCYSFRSDGVGLPDASKGDQIQLAHVHNDTVTSQEGVTVATQRTVDVLTASNVTLVGASAAVPVSGTFTNIGSGKTINVVLDRPSFDALYPDGDTDIGPLAPELFVTTNPLGDFGFNLGPPIFGATMPGQQVHVALSYDDPYPAGWQRSGVLFYDRRRWLAAPGATTSAAVRVNANRAFVLNGAVPSTPALGPPTGVMVGGHASEPGGRATFDGQAPLVISWNAVGTADDYTVSVVKLIKNGTGTEAQAVAYAATAGTSVSIPADVLAPGFYAFTVTAVKDGGSFAAGHLLLSPYLTQVAGVATGRFRLDTTCGDGHVDSGEDCDPGASETAQCDLDCTKPVCGDGHANTLAGETCDGGGHDIVGCDSDCTAVVCGDGHVNAAAGETCDPPGVNGCSADCH